MSPTLLGNAAPHQHQTEQKSAFSLSSSQFFT